MSSSTLTQYATTHPVPTRTQRNSADPGGHSQAHVPALGRILVKCRLSRGGIGARNSGELAFVMPGLAPGVHVFPNGHKTWMAGTSVQSGDMADTCSETSPTVLLLVKSIV